MPQLQQISEGRECYVLSEAPQLSINAEKSNEKRAVAKGIAISTRYNTKFYRFTPASVQSLRPQAIKTETSNGVPMHVLHMTFWELPVGRTLNAIFKKQTDLEVEFYLSRNVPQPHTNSIIDRIDDKTIDSLSMGWGFITEGQRKTYFKCDVCGEKMDRGYYMPYDSNYHFPGKKIKENNEDIIVTATVHGDITFRELSIVGGGADPRAKILGDTEQIETLKTEFQTLQLQPEDFATVAELAGWNEVLFTDTLALGIYNPTVHKPRLFGGFDMTDERTEEQPTEEQPTPNLADESASSVADGLLKEHYEAAKQQIATLQAERANMMLIEEHDTIVTDLRTQINEQKAALAAAQTEAEENTTLATIGREALETARMRTEHAYRTAKGNKVEDPRSQRDIEKIQKSTSIKWLSTEMDKLWDHIGEHQKTNAARDADMAERSQEILRGVELNIGL